MMMLICIKQHLSNFCRSIHEVQQVCGWAEKSVVYKKSVYNITKMMLCSDNSVDILGYNIFTQVVADFSLRK